MAFSQNVPFKFLWLYNIYPLSLHLKENTEIIFIFMNSHANSKVFTLKFYTFLPFL